MGRCQVHRQGHGHQGPARARPCSSAPRARTRPTPSPRWSAWSSAISTKAAPMPSPLRLHGHHRLARLCRRPACRARAAPSTRYRPSGDSRAGDRGAAICHSRSVCADRRTDGVGQHRCRRHAGVPACDARGRVAGRTRLREHRCRHACRCCLECALWTSRSPSMTLPRTSISGPVPPTCVTFAIALSAPLPVPAEIRPPAGADPRRRRHYAQPVPRRDWSKGGGIVLRAGSAASHVAMLARARGVPMLVGVAGLRGRSGSEPPSSMPMLASSSSRRMPTHAPPSSARRTAGAARTAAAAAIAGQAAATADGTADRRSRQHRRAVRCRCHRHCPLRRRRPDAHRVSLRRRPARRRNAISRLSPRARVGTGQAGGHPHRRCRWRQARAWLHRRRVQPVSRPARHPAGPRQVRTSSASRSALCCALHMHGNLRVMFPMIAIAAEYARPWHCSPQRPQLRGCCCSAPPAAARHHGRSALRSPSRLRRSASVAFFSIGSNDLTQYVMAAGRDNGAVAALNDVTNPAVVALVRRVAEFGKATRHSCQSLRRCGRRSRGASLRCSTPVCAAFRSSPAQLPLAKLAISGGRLGAA